MDYGKSKIEKWLQQLSEREKIYVFLFGFALIYLFFFLFFFHPLTKQKKALTSSITTMKTQQGIVMQQMKDIKKNINTPVFMQMMKEYKKLTWQLQQMDQQIEQLKLDLFSSEPLSLLNEKILKEHKSDSGLLDMKEEPIEPWPAKELIEKNKLLMNITPGYQHALQMEFKNNYFNTINYLANIEKLSNHIHWDSMDYKVLQYPMADVIVKFHVLTLQKRG